MGLLGYPTYLFILPYSAGILGVIRAGWYPSCLNNDHPSAADILPLQVYLKSVTSDA